MINLNAAQNEALLSQCKPLSDYAEFVNRVKLYLTEGLERTSAVDKAVDDAIKENLLDGYFRKHKAEVTDMILAEYDAEDTMREFYKYGKEEGREEGYEAGRIDLIKQMMQNGIKPETIAQSAGIPLESVLSYL